MDESNSMLSMIRQKSISDVICGDIPEVENANRFHDAIRSTFVNPIKHKLEL